MSSTAPKIGYNDIGTTHPDLIQYLVDKDDALKFKAGSNKKIKVKCNVCGCERFLSVYDFTTRGFSCSQCSDGISVPEKFMYRLLKENKIDFEYQKTFDWAHYNNKKLRYDFYFEKNKNKYIIETDGGQHFYKGFIKDVNIVKHNDYLKEKLAVDNGITVIRIDCRKSDVQFIIKNIMKSKLIELIDIDDDIIYNCKRFATNNSMLTLVCDLWKTYKDIYYVRTESKLCNATVKKYLLLGNELGIINIDYKAIIKNNQVKTIQHYCNIPIYCIETKEIFDSAVMCAKYFNEVYHIKMDSALISRVCKGSNSHHKGYHFIYLSEKQKGGDAYDRKTIA